MDSNRNLTDDDVEAIAEKVIEQLKIKWFSSIGEGVWKYVWTAILGVIITIAFLSQHK